MSRAAWREILTGELDLQINRAYLFGVHLSAVHPLIHRESLRPVHPVNPSMTRHEDATRYGATRAASTRKLQERSCLFSSLHPDASHPISHPILSHSNPSLSIQTSVIRVTVFRVWPISPSPFAFQQAGVLGCSTYSVPIYSPKRMWMWCCGKPPRYTPATPLHRQSLAARPCINQSHLPADVNNMHHLEYG